MTSGQRKAHRYIWLLLIIIVPLIIILSMKDLTIFSSETTANTEPLEIPKKDVLKTSENELIKAALYKNSINIILKSTLKNPSSVIYAMDIYGKKAAIIGQLTTSGIYNFTIKNLPKGIVVYDALKNVEITKLTF